MHGMKYKRKEGSRRSDRKQKRKEEGQKDMEMKN